MCFYDEADWYADVQEESMRVARKDLHCDECGETIHVGDEYRHIFQQESEVCATCDDGFCDCPKDEDGDCPECKCESPDYGESYEYHACLNCKKFLDAVEATEKEENCPAHAQRPLLCTLVESIGEKETDDARKYFNTAIRMFPELKQSGYLDVMWRRMFGVAAV